MSRSLLLYFCLILISFSTQAQEVPFNKGVNLTNWFQVPNPRQIQFSKYTKQDFENIKSLGCDAIRLPINLHFMTDGVPNYQLDPLFLTFLDQVVDWAEELEIHLILDNHTFSVDESTDPNIGPILETVWTQMAEHYKNRSEYIYYEILNEPHGISDEVWNTIQQKVVEAIRQIDSLHTIIIGPANWNSFANLDDMPVYEDDNLIYTFHFYEPFIFTHQGASWTDPSLTPLANVPFPYSANEMPNFPPSLEGNWVEFAFLNYGLIGTVDIVKSLIDQAAEFKESRNVPVYCGEFGVYIPNSNNEDRVFWYETVRKYLEEKDIPWTIWDYQGGFGLFEAGSNELFEHDLNIPLLEALTLNTPNQTPYIPSPESAGFAIYDDAIGKNIVENSHGEGSINFYSDDLPQNGNYCIHWTGAGQYNAIGFEFRPKRDLTRLLAENYALDLFIKGDRPSGMFDLRFMDDKLNPSDRPWRMRFTVNENSVQWNGEWQHLHIPLKDFREHGAWDNGWYNPEGKFDWSDIDRFEIVTEHHPLGNNNLWLDQIYITNQNNPTSLSSLKKDINVRFFPNPTQNVLHLSTTYPNKLTYKVIDMLGRVRYEGALLKETTINLASLPKAYYTLSFSDGRGFVKFKKILKK